MRPITRRDLWQALGLVVFVCSAISGDLGVLPDAIKGWAQWFKFVGYVGGLVQAYRIMPLQRRSRNRQDGVRVDSAARWKAWRSDPTGDGVTIKTGNTTGE